MSLYAKHDNLLQDRAGANFDIQIGGINDNAPEDNEGPIINLYMNDESFISGGITNESPTLLARLQSFVDAVRASIDDFIVEYPAATMIHRAQRGYQMLNKGQGNFYICGLNYLAMK